MKNYLCVLICAIAISVSGNSIAEQKFCLEGVCLDDPSESLRNMEWISGEEKLDKPLPDFYRRGGGAHTHQAKQLLIIPNFTKESDII